VTQPLPSQRHLFEIPDEVAYLNAAAYVPLPRAVREAGQLGVTTKTIGNMARIPIGVKAFGAS
jgi:hypothetical protein